VTLLPHKVFDAENVLRILNPGLCCAVKLRSGTSRLIVAGKAWNPAGGRLKRPPHLKKHERLYRLQTVTFAPTPARALRLKALSEAGNRGEFNAVSELFVLGNEAT
jgi:hypothetical protein